VPTYNQIKLLIGPPKLYIRLKLNRIIALYEWIDKLEHAQRLVFLYALCEVIPLQQSCYGIVRKQCAEMSEVHVFVPDAVEDDLGFVLVEDLECLRCIGLSIILYLLLRQDRPQLIAARGIPDTRGKITNDKVNGMA